MVRSLGVVLAFTLLACGGGSKDEESPWIAVEGLPEAYLYGAVWSFGPEDVWLTADGARVLHFDGSEWTEIVLETNDTMSGIWAFARDDMWMVGGDTLARYDGSTWTITDFTQESPGIEGLTSIWGSAPDDVWVVGTQSTAAHWNGSVWQRYIAAGTENTAVWGSGPSDVYVVGIFDVAHWNGNSFEEVDVGIHSAEGVWGFAEDDVWAVDGNEEVAHFDGLAWTTTELDVFGGPSTLWGLAPDDLWGVGSFGSIVHYDGQRWRELAAQEIGSPFLRSFHGIHGSSRSDVWAVGSQAGEDGLTPLLWRYDPG